MHSIAVCYVLRNLYMYLLTSLLTLLGRVQGVLLFFPLVQLSGWVSTSGVWLASSQDRKWLQGWTEKQAGEMKGFSHRKSVRVRNLKFARNLKFVTSKTLVNFMKKMMFLSKNCYFSVQKALIYYTVNKSHHNSFILLVFSHVVNFRYVANFRFLTLQPVKF